MVNFSDSYTKLLNKFKDDPNLWSLLNECMLDNEDKREQVFALTGKYPEQRNLIMKLKYDILKVKLEEVK